MTELQLSHTLLVCGQDKSGAFSHHVNVVGTPAFPKPELHSQMHPPTSPHSTLSVYRQTKGFLPARDGSSAPAVMACFHPRHWQRPSDCLRLGHFCTLKSPCLTPVNWGWLTCTENCCKKTGTKILVRFDSASRPTQQHSCNSGQLRCHASGMGPQRPSATSQATAANMHSVAWMRCTSLSDWRVLEGPCAPTQGQCPLHPPSSG